MDVLSDFMREYFTIKFIELLAGLCGLIVVISLYHLFNSWLSSRIRSGIFRRFTVWVIAIIFFSFYYLLFETGRIDEVKERDMRIYYTTVISTFIFFHLFYLFTFKLSEKKMRWAPALKFVIMFLMFWVFMASMLPLDHFLENSNRSLQEILIGNYHLSEEIRIHSFKKEIIFNIVVAFEATMVDFGCRYVLKLQQERKKIKELQNIQLREQLTKAQLDALHAKINPHFLYNALNSIAGLALTDPQKTRSMAVSLSKFFRYSINGEQNNKVTIEDELNIVETYLEIEKIRFEDRLTYEINMQPGLEKQMIPRFILQPLVENSVKHGLKGGDHNLVIRINIGKEDKTFSLTVQDNGLPFPENLEPGYGLKSVYDKLDLLFPGKYEVALFNTPVKQVRIQIDN
jgi:sensor histidine kinase YesM